MNEIPSYQLSKAEGAKRQLCAAIRMFFNGWDDVAVYSLACSSGEVFRHLAEKAQKKAFILQMLPFYDSKSELVGAHNQVWNFFKHADRDPDAVVVFSRELVDLMLWVSLHDATLVLVDAIKVPEIKAYYHWFLHTSPDLVAESITVPANRAIIERMDANVPGMRAAPRDEQMRFGMGLLIAADQERIAAAVP